MLITKFNVSNVLSSMHILYQFAFLLSIGLLFIMFVAITINKLRNTKMQLLSAGVQVFVLLLNDLYNLYLALVLVIDFAWLKSRLAVTKRK